MAPVVRRYDPSVDERWAEEFLDAELGGRRQARRGTALVNALVALVRARAVSRIWVVTTNDDLDALAFYQRRGFRLTYLRPGAIDEARRTLRPEIPLVGEHGLAMRDELELAMTVGAADWRASLGGAP